MLKWVVKSRRGVSGPKPSRGRRYVSSTSLVGVEILCGAGEVARKRACERALSRSQPNLRSSDVYCSDSLVDNKAKKFYQNHSSAKFWLCGQIEREQQLRAGAEKLLRATCNEKLRHIVSKELASINANLQAMREELSEITSSSSLSNASSAAAGVAGMALFLASNNNNVSSRRSSKQYGTVSVAGSTPMIALHLKETVDFDYISAFSTFISTHYYEDPAHYAKQLNTLNSMRKNCNEPSWTDACVQHLFTYYNQLYFVDRRFYPSTHYYNKVTFEWYDAFSGVKSIQKSIGFEKGSILFNIGVVFSQRAARQSRRDVVGLKAAADDFCASAGAFRCLRDSFVNAPSVDMQPSTTEFLIHVMLTQARESTLESTLLQHSSSSSSLVLGSTDVPSDFVHYIELAQEAALLTTQYDEALRQMSSAPLAGYLPATWLHLFRCKRFYYESVARSYMAVALLRFAHSVQTDSSSAPYDKLIRKLINAHSRIADISVKRMTYCDTVVETQQGRTVLAKAHLKQAVLASEEALKLISSQSELIDFQPVLRRHHDRSMIQYSELEDEDDFTELLLAPDVSARTKVSIEPVLPDFVEYKVEDLFHQLGCLVIFSARHSWTAPRTVTLSKQGDNDEFGFSVRGEGPVIVATVDEQGLAQTAGVLVGDFIIAVNSTDVKWSTHDQVVTMIRASQNVVKLSLVTPIDCNYIEPTQLQQQQQMSSTSPATSPVAPSTPTTVTPHDEQPSFLSPNSVLSLKINSPSELRSSGKSQTEKKSTGSTIWLFGGRRGNAVHRKKQCPAE